MAKPKLHKLLTDDSGATAIEYGMIAASMGLAMLAIIPTLAQTTKTKFFDTIIGLFAQV
jgi:Flp pilus assembly pilin Flp